MIASLFGLIAFIVVLVLAATVRVIRMRSWLEGDRYAVTGRDGPEREPFWWPMAAPPLPSDEREEWSWPFAEEPIDPRRDLIYLDVWHES